MGDKVGACYAQYRFQDDAYTFGRDDTILHPLWRYHVCQYPQNQVGGIQMHSYIWIGQRMHGNGFDLLEDHRDSRLRTERLLNDTLLRIKLVEASASLNCKQGRPVDTS